MKRILSLCFAFVLVFSMMAFAHADEHEPVTLTVWHTSIEDNRKAVFDEAIARFNEEYPYVTVNSIAIENDTYKTKIVTAMGSGDAPDLFHNWGGGWLDAFIQEGLVYNITDAVVNGGIADETSPSVRDLACYNGQYYGLPYVVTIAPIFYNKVIFEQLDIEFPKTMSEMEAACDKLVANGYIPFALGNSPKWPGCLELIYRSMRYGGTDLFSKVYNHEEGYTFENEAYIKAGQGIQDSVKKNYYPVGCNGIANDAGGSRMLLYSNKAAMLMVTTSALAQIRNENPDFYENNLAVGAYPALDDKPETIHEIVGGGYVMSISESCKNKEEAVALLKYLCDAKSGKSWMENASSLPPQSGVTSEDPRIAATLDIINNATFSQNYFDQALRADLIELHKDTTQALFGLDMTPEEAARKMAERDAETK